jgi:catalase
MNRTLVSTLALAVASATIVVAPAALSQTQAASRQMTQDSGAPIGDNQDSKAAGDWGGVMLEDFQLVEKLSRFDRERIPERVVHARGTGAGGSFVSTGALSQYTRAALFASGVNTPVFVRFSAVIHPKGSPESLRDPRGFATKFYTSQGNWDLVGNDLPIFFIRDAMKFPDMVHSLKPSPITNIQDPNRFFDFFSHVPESTHMLTQVYSDLGTPASYRTMDGFGVHAFKLVAPDGSIVYAKFHWKARQGVHSLNGTEAAKKDFNFMTQDLYEHISAGDAPKWDLMVKILKVEDIKKLPYNAFDDTKDWLDMPEILVGTMTLDKVPDNFFESTEEAAFDPGVMVPGIEPSPDRMLQGRIFSYSDTQRYRLGGNYQMLPINRPLVEVVNGAQDGVMDFGHRKGDVNYQPSRSDDAGSYHDDPAWDPQPYQLTATVQRKAISVQDNFTQAGVFYRNLDAQNQADLIANLAGDLNKVHDAALKATMIGHFYAADAHYGERLAEATHTDLGAVKAAAAAAIAYHAN